METIFCTLVVSAPFAALARQLAAALPSGGGMFVAAFSPTGSAPATHYVSEGYIDQPFFDALQSPEALVALAEQAGQTLPLAYATALLANSVISTRRVSDLFAPQAEPNAEQPNPEPSPFGAAGLSACHRASINDASVAELEAAPGIGPEKAGVIVAMRPWATVADLTAVAGIGPDQIAELERWYTA